MWLDTDSNVPGEVTKPQLYGLLEVAKEVEVPIYVVFPRHHSRVMLKRKLTHTSYIEKPDNFLWYQDRDGLTKRVGSDARAMIFTNYFHAYACWQKVLKGLVDA